ncbi:uncharacterized protein LOC142099457 isoform X2 [Mixophyes fleayi]|uniref:uncharacterized protein LOC142099457 isoform X2 n=1 Tax=Mixophyes fleayi TaxID=3061075 RepID=UPI003F4DA0AE
MEEQLSWTDDLPLCHLSGVESATNQTYNSEGLAKEEHPCEDNWLKFRNVVNMSDEDAGPSQSSCTSKTKRRQHNFTSHELDIIIEMAMDKLHSSNRQLSTSSKARIWDDITQQVNVVAPCRRLANEVKKRWFDFKQKLKQKVRDQRAHSQATGGGFPAPLDLAPLEKKALACLDDASVLGVGYIDTGCLPPLLQPLSPLALKEEEVEESAQEENQLTVVEVALDGEEIRREQARVTLQQTLSHFSEHVQHHNDAIVSNTCDISNTLARIEHKLDTNLQNMNSNLHNINSTLTNLCNLFSRFLDQPHTSQRHPLIDTPSPKPIMYTQNRQPNFATPDPQSHHTNVSPLYSPHFSTAAPQFSPIQQSDPNSSLPPAQPPDTSLPPAQPPDTSLPPAQPPDTSLPPAQPPDTSLPPAQPHDTSLPPAQPPDTSMPSVQPPAHPPSIYMPPATSLPLAHPSEPHGYLPGYPHGYLPGYPNGYPHGYPHGYLPAYLPGYPLASSGCRRSHPADQMTFGSSSKPSTSRLTRSQVKTTKKPPAKKRKKK